MLHNFLSRPLSFLGWTTAMLFWLDFHQTQSNLYKWFRMQRHDWSSTNPKEPMLHLSLSPCTGLPVAARIKFKTLMLAYRTATGSAPSYFHSLLRIYIPSRSLRSASERRLVVPSQRGSKSLSRTFTFTIPGWWNDLPTPIRNAGSLCQSSNNNWKLISFDTTWIHPKLKKKKKTFSFSFSLFIPSLASLYLFEQCLRLGVTSTSSVWLPLQDESLYVFPDCKSLWIKAYAKLLNVNVNVPWRYFKFPSVNISKLRLNWLVICIAKNLIWTTLKEIFSIFGFFCTLRFQIFK